MKVNILSSSALVLCCFISAATAIYIEAAGPQADAGPILFKTTVINAGTAKKVSRAANGPKLLSRALSYVKSRGGYSQFLKFLDGSGYLLDIEKRLTARNKTTLLVMDDSTLNGFMTTKRMKYLRFKRARLRVTAALHVLQGKFTFESLLALPPRTKIFTNMIGQPRRIIKLSSANKKAWFQFVSKTEIGPKLFAAERTLYDYGDIAVVKVNRFLRWNWLEKMAMPLPPPAK